MGLPVTLEGNNYKFNGTISDVRVTTKTDVEDDGSNNQVGQFSKGWMCMHFIHSKNSR